MRRVAISGVGLVSPTGNSLESFWQALVEGRSGIDRVTRFDPTSYNCQIGGEVRDLSYEDLIDPRKLRTTAHATQLALGAAALARRDARLPAGACDPSAVGVCIGSACGGWREAVEQYGILLERGARRVNPFIGNGAMPHAAGIEVASAQEAQGAQITFSNSCPAGLQAIGFGASLVASGELDVCFAGGTESPLSPLVFAAMGRTQELSTQNESPQQASRPFDRGHSGLVLSEGACMLVLEPAEAVARRGGKSYAEVAAFASSCDAKGLYGAEPNGEVAARAVHRALELAGLGVLEIDYLCAYANSSPPFDRKEALVAKRAFGEYAARLPVSSIKGVLGHPFATAGPFQTVTAAMAMRSQLIPPTHNLEIPDPECDLDHVIGEARPARVRSAMVSSYGYGGLNAYLILRAAAAE